VHKNTIFTLLWYAQIYHEQNIEMTNLLWPCSICVIELVVIHIKEQPYLKLTPTIMNSHFQDLVIIEITNLSINETKRDF